MTMFIIHHDDADGRCAAAVAAKYAKIKKQAVAFIKMEYGEAFDWELLATYDAAHDEVWVLDFSLPEADMDRMRRLADGRFVWIDHHYTAIEKLDAFKDVRGTRQTGRAACLLTWEYCDFGYQPPLALRLIADRDVWAFEYGDISRHFHEAFWLESSEPWSGVWDRWLRPLSKLSDDLRVGEILYRRKQKSILNTFSKLGRVEKLHGTDMTVLTCNCIGTGELGQAARDIGHQVLHTYYEHVQNGRLVRTHSLYAATVDVGALAKERGGGGHKGASGWVEVVK